MRYVVVGGEHGRPVHEIRLKSKEVAFGIADLLIRDLDEASGRVEVYDSERDSERPLYAVSHTK